MKLKIFILFLLVFGAIGQTIFLNIDAKSNFLEEKAKSSYIHASESDLKAIPVHSSEVVVTIRTHDSEILNQNADVEETNSPTSLNDKKTCTQQTKEERLICQKAKEAAKQKQIRISGSNHAKSSTIQNP